MATKNLVPVFVGTLSSQNVQLCNARDLHAYLAVGRDFTTWIKARIEEYGFIEGEDYSPVSGRIAGKRGQPRTEYHLTLDTAKELAMVENNERGRIVRRYFIQIEKDARAKVGAAGTALQTTAGLDKDTEVRINRHAWALAQATFERFRRELTSDIQHGRHRTAVEDWKPKEYREEFFEQLAANAEICRTFADGLHRNAKALALMAGTDYAPILAKYCRQEMHG